MFIQNILDRIDKTGVIGIGLVGSYARGEENKFSDVDLHIFVNKLPESDYERYTLCHWEDRLVSLAYVSIEDERASLSKPERAIWSVPGLKQMKILFDPNGELDRLQKAAQEFNWLSLQPAADEYAAEEVMGFAEEVHKILSGLARKHESIVLYAVWGLVSGMLRTVAVQRGLMIVSENRYFDLIQDSVGRETEWTRAFRAAWGLDDPGYESRGRAALSLYRHTERMFDDLIPAKHREIVDHTLKSIEEAGY